MLDIGINQATVPTTGKNMIRRGDQCFQRIWYENPGPGTAEIAVYDLNNTALVKRITVGSPGEFIGMDFPRSWRADLENLSGDLGTGVNARLDG